jgi:hypothetical protein
MTDSHNSAKSACSVPDNPAMTNRESRRIDAEKIRQDYVKSQRLQIPLRPIYLGPIPTIRKKPPE